MKIDLSTLLLVVIVVIPGLVAQRARDLLMPRSLVDKGASEELAELVAFGVFTHGVLAFFFAIVLLLIGTFSKAGPLHYFASLDQWHVTAWANSNRSLATIGSFTYIFLSFFASHCLGLLFGVLNSEGGLTARIVVHSPWLQRFGITGLLGERPIIYELLNAEADADGNPKTIFLEAEMKNGLVFYSGQLSQFAIVRDEEAHRPLYMIDPWYKGTRTDSYVAISADGILIDLADVACLLIKQVQQTEQG